jgi:NAD(P)H-hydrate epimerase
MMSEISANLPQFAYTAQQVKHNEPLVADAKGIELYELMQHAARAVFDFVAKKI